MKPLIIGILSLWAVYLPGQTWVDLTVMAGLKYTSGYHRGRMDAAMFHYSTVKKVSPWYDDPSKSWVNKWAIDQNGMPIVGTERFWGSSRWFVQFTDDWHFDNFVRNQSQNLSIVYMSWATDRTAPMKNWYEDLAGRTYKSKPWWAYGGEYLAASLADSAGFYTAYNAKYQP